MRSSWRLGAIILMALTGTPLLGQQRTVAGIVVDDQGRPMPKVEIQVVGTAIGTVSAEDGRFLLTGLPGTDVTLQARLMGYRAAGGTFRVGARDVRLIMSIAPMILNEVVVTGTATGTQTRALGNVIAKVDVADALSVQTAPGIETLLSATVAGLVVPSTPGNVGTGSNIRIRGSSSMTLGSNPLVYLDGIRVDNTQSEGLAGGMRGGAVSRLNDLNPNDFDKVEVIKGPAAATLFGTEATAGVIVITSKTGETGKTLWDVDLTQGATVLMDAVSRWPSVYDKSTTPCPGCVLLPGGIRELNVLQADIQNGYGLPWVNGHDQSAYVSAHGGSPLVRYYGSAEVDRTEGYVPWNWQDKKTLRLNLNITPRENIAVASSMGFVSQTTQFDSPGPFPAEIGSSIYWGTPAAELTRSHGWNWMTPAALATMQGKEGLDRFFGSISLRNTPRSWFTQSLKVGTDIGDATPSRMIPRSPLGSSDYFGPLNLGHIEVATNLTTNFNLDYGATAIANVRGGFVLETSGGAQFLDNAVHSWGATGDQFPAPGPGTVSSAAIKTGSEDFLENKAYGIYGQEQLGWNDRRFLTVGLRGDENSAFGSNVKFIMYPKVSASWVLNEESFWKLPAVNQFKLRVAWGEAGRQPSVIEAARLYAPFTAAADQAGLRPSAVGNPNLKPEVGVETEVGFDASVWQDRLGIKFTYYDKKTKDAIVQKSVPASSGFGGTEAVNVGLISNAGMELELNSRVLEVRNLSADVLFTLATNRSDVISLGGLPPIYDGSSTGTVEGKPLGAVYSPHVLSAQFDASGKIINDLCEATPQQGGGTVPCSQAQQVYRGPALPTWMGTGGITLHFFQNVQFNAQVAFQGGNTKISGDLAASHLLFKNSLAVLQRNNPILATMDEIVPGGYWTQAGVMNAGFAKLRDVSLSYSLPQQWASRLGGASRGTFSLGARNILTLWTAQKGTFGRNDIEVEQTEEWRPGNELGVYNQTSMPIPATFQARLRLTY